MNKKTQSFGIQQTLITCLAPLMMWLSNISTLLFFTDDGILISFLEFFIPTVTKSPSEESNIVPLCMYVYPISSLCLEGIIPLSFHTIRSYQKSLPCAQTTGSSSENLAFIRFHPRQIILHILFLDIKVRNEINVSRS